MAGGFAVIAWPVKYGDSGIMTFIINRDAVSSTNGLGPRHRRSFRFHHPIQPRHRLGAGRVTAHSHPHASVLRDVGMILPSVRSLRPASTSSQHSLACDSFGPPREFPMIVRTGEGFCLNRSRRGWFRGFHSCEAQRLFKSFAVNQQIRSLPLETLGCLQSVNVFRLLIHHRRCASHPRQA